MDFFQITIFMIFILLNSYFSYSAGKKEGMYQGMISITQFFKTKNAFVDKNKITGYKNWPTPIRHIFQSSIHIIEDIKK